MIQTNSAKKLNIGDKINDIIEEQIQEIIGPSNSTTTPGPGVQGLGLMIISQL